MKSSLVEEAVHELINMLESDHSQREEEEKAEEESSTESKTMDHMDSDGMLAFYFTDQID